MTTPLIGVQVTGIDTIDLLKPTLNVHESHTTKKMPISDQEFLTDPKSPLKKPYL